MQKRAASFEPAGFFVLRRPLLSLQTLYDFHQKTHRRQEVFQQELIRLFSQPLLAEAICLASPSLYNSLSKVIAANTEAAGPAVFQALYKYLIRMCSRATPYGLFSGFTTGIFSETTRMELEIGSEVRRYTRLDMRVASELASSMLAMPDILAQTRFFVNSSLYALGDQFRFVERINTEKGQVNVLSAVARDELLELALRITEKGCTFSTLTGYLAEKMPAGLAPGYVIGLVHMQILVSELEMNVTGRPYLDILGDHLCKINGAQKQACLVRDIRALLSEENPLHTISRQLSSLLKIQGITSGERVLLHTDTKLPTRQCEINSDRIMELSAEFEQVSMLFEFDRKESDMEKFKRAFVRRYENQEVPLLEALDAESGIGYGMFGASGSAQTPLLDNLRISTDESDRAISRKGLTEFKERLLNRADRENVLFIELGEKDMKDLKKTERKPGYFYWLGSIITEGAEQFDQGNFHFLLRALGGCSGVELLGRFSHAAPDLAALACKLLREQQQVSDAVYAEVAHLPSAGSAAILSRSHLSDYEIVYLAGSTKPVQQQIFASDLLVSVPEGKQVIIRSRRINKRVIPVLTTAHNFSRGLPVYRFLCDMATENQSYAGWNWGRFASRDFLPRLSYKHLVISRATWNLTADMFDQSTNSSEGFTTSWKAVSRRLNIPRYILICRHDQELLIDSYNSFSLELLREAVRKTGKVRIVEFLQEPGGGLISGKKMQYVHELVIPFRPLSQNDPPALSIRTPQYEQRRFLTTSSWLFVKIYLGTSTADRIIAELLDPYCQRMVKTGRLEKWFFIRYHDPDHHIRLRFHHSVRLNFWQQILTDLNELLRGWMDSGLIARIQTDTYSRELERYQELTYDSVESIFHADSRAVASLMNVLSGLDQPETERWLIAFLGADLLMDDLGLALGEKLGLVSRLFMNLSAEFATPENLTVQLDRQYRSHRNMISVYMSRRAGRTDEIFAERSMIIRQLLLKELSGSNLTTAVVASFVHMFFNRMFASAWRQQEMVIYHYLGKYYKSLIARSKNGGKISKKT